MSKPMIEELETLLRRRRKIKKLVSEMDLAINNFEENIEWRKRARVEAKPKTLYKTKFFVLHFFEDLLEIHGS